MISERTEHNKTDKQQIGVIILLIVSQQIQKADRNPTANRY